MNRVPKLRSFPWTSARLRGLWFRTSTLWRVWSYFNRDNSRGGGGFLSKLGRDLCLGCHLTRMSRPPAIPASGAGPRQPIYGAAPVSYRRYCEASVLGTNYLPTWVTELSRPSACEVTLINSHNYQEVDQQLGHYLRYQASDCLKVRIKLSPSPVSGIEKAPPRDRCAPRSHNRSSVPEPWG
jgi:hypothetical protein